MGRYNILRRHSMNFDIIVIEKCLLMHIFSFVNVKSMQIYFEEFLTIIIQRTMIIQHTMYSISNYDQRLPTDKSKQPHILSVEIPRPLPPLLSLPSYPLSLPLPPPHCHHHHHRRHRSFRQGTSILRV